MFLSLRSALAAISLLVPLTACTSGDASQTTQSIMFRGEPTHAGLTSERLFTGQGGIRWSTRTGGVVRSTPAISGERLFVGSGDGFLYALDRTDGSVQWRFDAGSPVHASPAIAGGLVVAASLGGKIFAVDRNSGASRWSMETGAALPLNTGRGGGWDIVVSSPTIVDDTVYVGGRDGSLYALDLATGTQIWKASTGGRVRATPSVSGDLVVTGSFDGRVYAFDRRTGAERWVHRTEGDTLDSNKFGYDRRAVQSTAAIVDGTVYLGARDGGLYAIDLTTGKRKWRASHGTSWVVGSPAVAGGRVYAGSSDGHFIQALDAATGRELWRKQTGANVLASPTLAGNDLVIATYRTDAPIGELRVLDPATGNERWRLRLNESIVSSPVIANREVYLGTDAGSIVAIARSAPVVPRLAVFFDSSMVSRAFSPGSRLAYDHFRDQGYEALTAPALAQFLTARIGDRIPSVVVFAMDVLPPAIAPVMTDSVLFIRYLRAGGKVVWMGAPPGSLGYDSTGRLNETENFDRVAALLGIVTTSMDYNELGGHPTPAGREWGLTAWHRGDYPIDTTVVTVALAVDEVGQTNAWVKSYDRDRPWSGFVQLWGFGATVDRLPDIQAVAEYGLLRPWQESGR